MIAKTDRNNWKAKEGKLFRRFEFANFIDSLNFVIKVGELAEMAGHHPDIAFGWGYAEITLYTHSENAISDKDYELAKQIDLI